MAFDITQANWGRDASLPGILQAKQFVMKHVGWTSTSTSYVNTPISGIITPSSADSKIIVAVDLMAYGDPGMAIRISRTVTGSASANPVVSDSSANNTAATLFASPYHGSNYHTGNLHYTYVDSPSATVAVTYMIQAYTYQNTMYLNRTASSHAYSTHGTSQITLMELREATAGLIT